MRNNDTTAAENIWWKKKQPLTGSNDALVFIISIRNTINLATQPDRRHSHKIQNQRWERNLPISRLLIRLCEYHPGRYEQYPADQHDQLCPDFC